MAYPTLRSNEVISALYNQIISINTEAKNISGVYGKLLEAMRVEGGMYGDTKVVIDTDCLESYDFLADTENQLNVLAIDRGPAPHSQEIVLNKFRQCMVTLDDYMTKRAFADEGSFASFNGVVRGWVADTKKVYDATTFNAFVGTTKSSVQSDVEIDGAKYASLGQGIAEEIANLMINLEDVSRDYNDLGFLRSYAPEDIIIVWNSEYVNHISKNTLPVLYHKEGLIEKFGDYVLPARYFGTINTASKTTADANTRALGECVVGSGVNRKHYFAGDKIASGTSLVNLAGAITVPSYQEDNKVICKVMAKGSVPFMSSFSVGTSFVNAKNLSENQYLTWSHNTLAYLEGKPFITVIDVTEEE